MRTMKLKLYDDEKEYTIIEEADGKQHDNNNNNNTNSTEPQILPHH